MNRRTVLADTKTSSRPIPRLARVRVGVLTEEEKKTSIWRGVVLGTVVIVSAWLFVRELRVS